MNHHHELSQVTSDCDHFLQTATNKKNREKILYVFNHQPQSTKANVRQSLWIVRVIWQFCDWLYGGVRFLSSLLTCSKKQSNAAQKTSSYAATQSCRFQSSTVQLKGQVAGITASNTTSLVM